jgi:ubiquitin-like 1-activating enzyme E1 A
MSSSSHAEAKTQPDSNMMSEAEAQLYDRQLRVWGVEAQRRMQQSHVLVVGCKGLGLEVLKTIVLAGVGNVTLSDPGLVKASDLAANFYLHANQIGQPRAACVAPKVQELNPLVKVGLDPGSALENKAEWFAKFDVVCVTGCGQRATAKIKALCKEDTLFFAGDCMGTLSYFLFDHGTFDYKVKMDRASVRRRKHAIPPDNDPSDTRVVAFESLENILMMDYKGLVAGKYRRKKNHKFAATYTLLQQLLSWRDGLVDASCEISDPLFNVAIPSSSDSATSQQQIAAFRKVWDSLAAENGIKLPADIDGYVRAAGCELPTVVAIVGGFIGQEILTLISRATPPLNNMMLYDLHEGGTMQLDRFTAE